MSGGPVLIALGSGAPVDPDAVAAAFCVRWSASAGAELTVGSIDDIATLPSLGGVVIDTGDADRLSALALAAQRSIPVALVSTRASVDAPGARDAPGVFRIAGRGIGGYFWGALHVLRQPAWPLQQIRYGDHVEHVADLRLPRGPGPHPIVVLLHGGGWKDIWRRDIMEGLAVDLAACGLASWNLDFRRVGPSGGGWPETFDDISAGVDALATAEMLDLTRIAIVGHSSGGALALAEAARARRRGIAGLRLVVSISGVVDLVEGARRGLVGGETILHRLLGGSPDDVPDRYRTVSPRHLLPLQVPQLLVQGLLDYIPDLVDLNRLYAAAARAAGDDALELLEFGEVDHLGPIDPANAAWAATRDRLLGALAPAPVAKVERQ